MNDEKARVRLHEWPPVLERATRGQDSGGVHEETVWLSPGSRRVWTDRMLEALARGNEGKKWHIPNDKVWSPRTLSAAVGPNQYFTQEGSTFLVSVTRPDPPAPLTG